MPALANPYSAETPILEFSYITGTGPYTLQGAMGSYLALSARYSNGNTVIYWAGDRSSKSELCTGTYNATAKTLTRSLIASTTGSLINWSGRTRVFIQPLVVPGLPPGITLPPGFAVCPTPPTAGQVLIWDAVQMAYCPADFCTLVAACLAPPPFSGGAVSLGGDAFGWDFPAMADSSSFSMSVWLYVASSQFASAPSPQGSMFGANAAYLFNDSGDSGQENFIGRGGFRSWHGVGGTDTPINDITNITRANPAVITFANPHGIDANTYLTSWTPGFNNAPDWNSAFTFVGADHITAVTSTTATVNVDTTGIASAWSTPSGSNTSGHAGVRFNIFNAMELQVGNSGSNSALYTWGKALPPGVWVNALLNVDTNHASGSKVATLYFGDTAVPLSALVDTSSAFSMFFSEADGAEGDSWKIGGNYSTSGVIAYMAEMWWAPGQLIDFTNPTNRAKFHDAMGHPVSLGADGSLPTGTKPMLYLHQPTSPRTSPVKWIDPGGTAISGAANVVGAYLEQVAAPLSNGITTTSLLTFSFWLDQRTVGDIMDLGNASGNGNINLYNGVCTVDLKHNSGGGRFVFSFPYSVGDGGNIRVGIDAGQTIGSKIVKAYVNGSAATVTVVTDNQNNLVMDWTGIIDFFFFSVGYIGDLWVAPNYYVDPGSYFYSAGAPGTLPPTTPSMYFHISGAQTADQFATNLGNGGVFHILGAGTPHFSLISGTEFFRNDSGNGSLKSPQFMTTLRVAPVAFP